MKRLPDRSFRLTRREVSVGSMVAVLVVALLVRGCATQQPEPVSVGDAQRFGSPDEAVNALVAAIRADDVERLGAIMGEESKEIVASGDDVADRAKRQQFLALYDQSHQIVVGRPGDDDDD